MQRAAAIALGFGALTGACFDGRALWGEPCLGPADCGPDLSCQVDLVCADSRACDELTLELSELRPRVVLLLDHSESMRRCLDDPDDRTTCITPGVAAPSRWDALHALALALVSSLADRLELAAIIFPSYSVEGATGTCGLDDSTTIPFAPDSAAAILAAAPRDDQPKPQGENPLRAAFSGARALLAEAASPAGSPSAIVLVTDNPPNCTANPVSEADLAEKLDPDVAQRVAAAAAEGVRTIVVGVSIEDALAPSERGDGLIDAVNPHLYFTELGLAGGAPATLPYIDLHDSAGLATATSELQAALALLAADFDACRVRLPAAPDYPDLVAVELGQRLRRADPDCVDELAWRFAGPAALELCAGACARLHAGERVRLRLGCP